MYRYLVADRRDSVFVRGIAHAMRMEPPAAHSAVSVASATVESVAALALLAIRRAALDSKAPVPLEVFARLATLRRPVRYPRPRAIRVAALLSDRLVLDVMSRSGMPIRERVGLMREWLRHGRYRRQEVDRHVAIALATRAVETLVVQMRGRVSRGGLAIVTGSSPLAVSVGFLVAPVVLASDPTGPGGPVLVRHTLARWSTEVVPHLSWASVADQFNAACPVRLHWSGSPADLRIGAVTSWNSEVVLWAYRRAFRRGSKEPAERHGPAFPCG